MRNEELMARLIIKNSPNLTYTKKELIKWLVESGKGESNAKRYAYKSDELLPVKEIIKGKFKLLVDPNDFYEPELPNAGKVAESQKEELKENIAVFKEVIQYLNLKARTRYKGSPKDATKVNARIKEGFKLEDFKQVIDKKTAEWSGTNMEAYLRPETLFGTKFESYLNQGKSTRPVSKSTEMAGYDFSKYIKGGNQ